MEQIAEVKIAQLLGEASAYYAGRAPSGFSLIGAHFALESRFIWGSSCIVQDEHGE
mgnify:CR=1 FL=1